MAVLVNGERIEDTSIHKEVQRLRPDYEKAFENMHPEEREAQLFDWSKENLIERTLLQQEVKNNEPEIPKDQLESIIANLKKEYKDPQKLYQEFEAPDDECLKRSIELIIRTERKLEKILKDLPNPSNTAIRQYYDQNKERFKTGDQIRVAHIVKYVNWQTDEAKAHTLISQAQDELQNGAVFEAIVDKYTDCTDQGGDLGYISRGQMAEEFEDVVFNLGVGQVSNVFRTRFGLHIAKVYGRHPPTVPGLDEVKDRITDILKDQMRENTIHEFIDNLKEKAKIEDIIEPVK